jgi:adenine deaminase
MPLSTLHATWRRLIVEEDLAPSDTLRVVTANVAEATGLARKGRIAPGLDADLVAFDDDWRIRAVIARGGVMVDAGQPVVRGMSTESSSTSWHSGRTLPGLPKRHGKVSGDNDEQIRGGRHWLGDRHLAFRGEACPRRKRAALGQCR